VKEDDCYIDIWRDANFGGESLRLYGPAEFPRLHFEQGEWGDQIGSLRVGPRAFVLAYRDRDFKDKKVTFGPNDEIADLSELKFDNDIDSVQVIDSLKIFDRLLGRTEPAAGVEATRGERKRGKRGGKKS
jgi:hypothetical protein